MVTGSFAKSKDTTPGGSRVKIRPPEVHYSLSHLTRNWNKRKLFKKYLKMRCDRNGSNYDSVS